MEIQLSTVYLLLTAVLVLVQRSNAFAVPTTPLSKRCSVVSTSTALKLASKTNEGTIEVSRSDGSTHNLSYRIVRPMSLSSRQAAPIVALHGGPSIPSNYLYPLEDVVPYRSIVFYDQLGCGKSDEPTDSSLYSTQNSVEDLKVNKYRYIYLFYSFLASNKNRQHTLSSHVSHCCTHLLLFTL